ncbi:MAG: FHA domain-containing protein, partial [Gammaproteobacteria bacterium]|nr:FHA domain-containing protein [Gammaproteobacteria bacterium]
MNRTFVGRFVVGRAPECEVSIADNGISRQHCELYHDGADWWVRDLASSNGTFIDGRQVTEARLGNDVRLEFYADGPVVRLQVDETQITHFAASSQQPAARPAEPRAALFQQTSATTTADDRRHHIRFVAGMSVMTVLLLVALVVIAIQYFQHADESDIAAQTFEQIKALELELARVKLELAQQPERPAPTALTNADQRLQAMKQRYAALAEERALLGSHRSKEDLLIFRIARVFGEYDLDIPDSFVAEVKRYIRVWQQSDRLVNAISR